MNLIGNILWILCGGLISSLSWLFAGIFWCITIIGIPYGLQCFKFSSLVLSPFGKEVVYDSGVISIIANIIWILFFFPALFIEHIMMGLLLCCTIVGIPFGLQHFKIAKLSFMPFGTKIVDK